MRRTALYTAAALLAVGSASGSGCSSKSTSGAASAAATSVAAPPAAPTARAATVLYTANGSGGRQVVGIPEDNSGAAQALTLAGFEGSFISALPARHALLAERNGDGSLARVISVGVDGSDRQVLATFATPAYRGTGSAIAAGDAIVVELQNDNPDAGDIHVLRAGAAPVVVARNARLIAAASGRVAVLTAGALRSVKLDGTGAIDLGGGDAQDQVVEVRGDRLLVTLHSSGKAPSDVRLVSLDGTVRVDVGQPTANETAFGTAAGRIVFVRDSGSGPVLVSTASNGSDERVLTLPDLKATPLSLLADGTTLFASVSGALMSVGPVGGRPRILDGAAGENITVTIVTDDRVIYTGVTPDAMTLRAARLDGSGHAVLCEKPFWMPYALALSPDHRLVFHRALAGQLEGGQVYSVALDGSDLRPLATSVVDPSGSARPEGPVDQDFEAITPSGRVILEAEFEGQRSGSLLVATPSSSTARQLTEFSSIRFAAVIPG